jgi:hypothetical protein
MAPSNLAKVGVAGSNPVVRSREIAGHGRCEPPSCLLGAAEMARGPVGVRRVHDFVTDSAAVACAGSTTGIFSA